MQDKLLGQTIDRYKIVEVLGAGGMATVYRALDTRLGREVAFKIIRAEQFQPDLHDKLTSRFLREANTLARLTHPNIVPLIDFGEYEGSPYLVMPLLTGGTLKQKLNGKPMPYPEAIRLLLPILRALDYAHRQGFVHRDLKPGNILLTESDEPMLADFGVVGLLDAGSVTGLTATGTGIGTPEYMAPEQWIGGDPDPRTDIYAIGVILYEMVTGRLPFQEENPAVLMNRVLTKSPPPPRKIIPSIPVDFEVFLIKCLSRKPEERFASAEVLLQKISIFPKNDEVQPVKKTKSGQKPVTPDEKANSQDNQNPELELKESIKNLLGGWLALTIVVFLFSILSAVAYYTNVFQILAAFLGIAEIVIGAITIGKIHKLWEINKSNSKLPENKRTTLFEERLVVKASTKFMMIGQKLTLPYLPVSIGAGLENDLSFPSENGLAKTHARIILDEGSPAITILDEKGRRMTGNRAKTLINHQPMTSDTLPLNNGDEIQLGETLSFRFEFQPEETLLQPAVNTPQALAVATPQATDTFPDEPTREG